MVSSISAIYTLSLHDALPICYLDFVGEVLGALRVADFALVVINAQHGIGVGTERVWNYATQLGIPKILVVTAVDKQNAHFDEVRSEEHTSELTSPSDLVCRLV